MLISILGRFGVLAAALAALLGAIPSHAATVGNDALDRYLAGETRRIATNTFAGIDTLDDWQQRRESLRQQLFEMLGLWPLPERSDLHATVTGTLEQEDFTVEKLHFQSLPGLYVTANLYRPKNLPGPFPAVLYACGHAQVKTNGLSCGNKTGYQHHGIWFARHGYVCLLIDTLQLGEIEGDHHGTYRLGQWWWNSRGYTPAGVEAWNGIRALDYLESRPDVDPRRMGMTGRSGGGSYTWTTAALDERVRVAAPVAGITDLENQVVDGVVEGHCDCMFFVNTYRWDFGLNAALLAPRPLLIVNTDSDSIFPLSGVQRLHAQVKRIYQLYHASTNLGLVIGPGPHQDTQDLQVPVFRWFHQHLKGEAALIEDAAIRRFAPLELRVFKELPSDQRNTSAQEWFGSFSPRPAPNGEPAEVLARLRQQVFAGWPQPGEPPLVNQPLSDRQENGWRHRVWCFDSQPHVPLRLHLFTVGDRPVSTGVLRLVDETVSATWETRLPEGWLPPLDRRENGSALVAVLETRGLGPQPWTTDPRKQVQIRRRFQLLGQTLDGMRIWDIRQAIRLLCSVQPDLDRLELHAAGPMSINALHAAVWESKVTKVVAEQWPAQWTDAPDLLNVHQIIDLPGLVQLARRRGIEVEQR
jgi:dienelactone hydrolase